LIACHFWASLSVQILVASHFPFPTIELLIRSGFAFPSRFGTFILNAISSRCERILHLHSHLFSKLPIDASLKRAYSTCNHKINTWAPIVHYKHRVHFYELSFSSWTALISGKYSALEWIGIGFLMEKATIIITQCNWSNQLILEFLKSHCLLIYFFLMTNPLWLMFILMEILICGFWQIKRLFGSRLHKCHMHAILF
jgi:hypothetical protein